MTQEDTRALRKVLGCYVTGVAILSTRTATGEHVAVTVNSFASVSLDPPLILFSLGKTSNILKHFQQAEYFSVNILGLPQEMLSNEFAHPSTASWDSSRYRVGDNGCALFVECLAYLECTRYAEIDGGDHRIFVARVTRHQHHQATDPLLYFRGRYGAFRGNTQQVTQMEENSLGEFTVQGWG